MAFTKLLSLIAGLVLISSVAFAGYAVTYATNSFGYSTADTYVTVDLTTHVDHYTSYPYNYNYYPNYGGYYYYGNYYYYPVRQVVNVVPTYTYTVVTTPVVYNYYPNGWYYA